MGRKNIFDIMNEKNDVDYQIKRSMIYYQKCL